jgi:hypothetical protein
MPSVHIALVCSAAQLMLRCGAARKWLSSVGALNIFLELADLLLMLDEQSSHLCTPHDSVFPLCPDAVWCGVVWCDVVWCDVVGQGGAEWGGEG